MYVAFGRATIPRRVPSNKRAAISVEHKLTLVQFSVGTGFLSGDPLFQRLSFNRAKTPRRTTMGVPSNGVHANNSPEGCHWVTFHKNAIRSLYSLEDASMERAERCPGIVKNFMADDLTRRPMANAGIDNQVFIFSLVVS